MAQLAEQQQARARDDNGAAERVLQQFEAAAAAYPEVLSTPPRVPREYPAYLESTLSTLSTLEYPEYAGAQPGGSDARCAAGRSHRLSQREDAEGNAREGEGRGVGVIARAIPKWRVERLGGRE